MSRGGPKLISRLYGHHTKEINDAIYVDAVVGGDDGAIVSISEDKQFMIWLKRDSGGYWPSVHEELPAPATALAYSPHDRRAYIGLATGAILIYSIQEDFNAITYVSVISSHKGRVTGIKVDKQRNLLVSCGRDKMVLIHDLSNNAVLSSYPVPAWVTVLDYDPSAPNIFVGDYGGRVHVLKLAKDTKKIQLIAALEGHHGSIRAIQWVREIGMLFTGSYDKTVIMWDIGRCKGEFFTLRGHKAQVDGLAYSHKTKQLITAGADKNLLVWDVGSHEFKMAPEWQKSDKCQLCDAPFFWNVQDMWETKTLAVNRQHHCRFSGKAVCDKCSPLRTTICSMGFELPVRVCTAVAGQLTDVDKVPRARAFPLGGTATVMHLETMNDETVLITGTAAGEICIWSLGEDMLREGGLTLTSDDDAFSSAHAEASAHVAGFGDHSTADKSDRVTHTAVYDTGYDNKKTDLLSQLDE